MFNKTVNTKSQITIAGSAMTKATLINGQSFVL